MTALLSGSVAALTGMLAMNSVWDFRSGEILLTPTCCCIAAGVMTMVAKGAVMREIADALLPGIAVLLLSLLSGGRLGMGDALVILALGAWLRPSHTIFVFALALVVETAAAALYRLTGGQKKELPFVPALFAGYVVSMVVGL